jgi:hypothetical protein
MKDAQDLDLKLNAVTGKDVHFVGRTKTVEDNKTIYNTINIKISIDDIKKIIESCK